MDKSIRITTACNCGRRWHRKPLLIHATVCPRWSHNSRPLCDQTYARRFCVARHGLSSFPSPPLPPSPSARCSFSFEKHGGKEGAGWKILATDKSSGGRRRVGTLRREGLSKNRNLIARSKDLQRRILNGAPLSKDQASISQDISLLPSCRSEL